MSENIGVLKIGLSRFTVATKDLLVFGFLAYALIAAMLYWDGSAAYAATLLLGIHIITASISLLAGTAAIVFRKGSQRHRIAGRGFMISMLVMGTSAAMLAAYLGKGFDVLSGLMACYFVITSWTTLRPISNSEKVRQIVAVSLLIFAYLALEFVAINFDIRNTDAPIGMGFIFAAILVLALIGDLVLLLRGEVLGRKRLARHLWRVCFALLLATVSFFLRTHLFPEVMQNSGVLYALALAPALIMLFWLVRVSRGKAL